MLWLRNRVGNGRYCAMAKNDHVEVMTNVWQWSISFFFGMQNCIKPYVCPLQMRKTKTKQMSNRILLKPRYVSFFIVVRNLSWQIGAIQIYLWAAQNRFENCSIGCSYSNEDWLLYRVAKPRLVRWSNVYYIVLTQVATLLTCLVRGV